MIMEEAKEMLRYYLTKSISSCCEPVRYRFKIGKDSPEYKLAILEVMTELMTKIINDEELGD